MPSERSTSDRLEVDDSKGGDAIGGDGVEFAKKSGKLKGQKLAKFQKLKGKKSKKPSKDGNSPNFDATEARSSFLISDARTAFNRLRLTFTKTPILWYFDPECHI